MGVVKNMITGTPVPAAVLRTVERCSWDRVAVGVTVVRTRAFADLPATPGTAGEISPKSFGSPRLQRQHDLAPKRPRLNGGRSQH